MANKKKINAKYQKQIEQIAQDEYDYSDFEMKPVYKEQKKSLTGLEVIIGAMFIKYSVDGLLKMTAKDKTDVEIDKTLKTMGKNLGKSEVEKVTTILEDIFKDTYYKNAFTMENNLKVEVKFDILKKEFIDSAVNSKLKDEMFDSRIWKNKADMIDKLHNGIVDAMQGKTTIDKLGRDIKNTFNVSAYESQRLVNTENARIQSQASIEIAKNTGIGKHMWSATLDGKTCDECGDNDGKIWNIDDDSSPQMPLHSNDRCCWINVIDEWSPEKRKDNETKEIIDYVDFKTWKANKNIE